MDGASSTQEADPAAGVDPNAAAPAPTDRGFQLHPGERRRIANKMNLSLEKLLLRSARGQLRKLVVQFEENTYIGATDRTDYLGKIHEKMLYFEKKHLPVPVGWMEQPQSSGILYDKKVLQKLKDVATLQPSAPARSDWREQLYPEGRSRIVHRIIGDLLTYIPVIKLEFEYLDEIKKISVRFEEKIYIAATSQSDYFRKISLKMLSMKTKTSAVRNQNTPGPGTTEGNQDFSEDEYDDNYSEDEDE